MNRRHLLQTLIGGGVSLMIRKQNFAIPSPQTLDMLGIASDTPFSGSSPGYLWKGLHVRFAWVLAIVRSPRRVLLQAAVQNPAYFYIFRYDNNNSIPLVTQGKVNPFNLWNTGTRRKMTKVNYVSEYLDLPAGTYVFMGQDETAGTERNECSISMRDMTVPGQQLKYNFVNAQPLLGVGAENTETPFGPFQPLGSYPNEVGYLKGCVNESNAGQVIEVLHEPQFLLWQQKKKYVPAFTFAHHFHTQYLAGAPNSKWYLLLKNPGKSPFVSTNSPVSLSYVWERWRKA